MVKTVKSLTAADSRSYGRIIEMVRRLGDMGYNSYCTLYDSYVVSVAHYAAGVFDFGDYSALWVLQNITSWFYLGVHCFVQVAATGIEINFPLIQIVR